MVWSPSAPLSLIVAVGTDRRAHDSKQIPNYECHVVAIGRKPFVACSRIPDGGHSACGIRVSKGRQEYSKGEHEESVRRPFYLQDRSGVVECEADRVRHLVLRYRASELRLLADWSAAVPPTPS